jgi:hypothetical protein
MIEKMQARASMAAPLARIARSAVLRPLRKKEATILVGG